ncbi:MAG: hypothetical protein P8J89_05115 [Phycisphaerales bacterium]|nr:hypothetical protein [Phycisphaerales bacterium]
MDKLQLYLDVVPLPLLLIGGFVAMMLFLIVPAERRMHLIFILLPSWLALSKCPDLGSIQALTKITSGMLFLLLGLAALLRPAARRRIPMIAWVYIMASGWLFLCILGVSELVDTMVIEFQWVMLVLASIAIVSTLTDLEDVEKIFWALGLGIIIALAIPLSAIVLSPGTAFIAGMNRFAPWGSPSNLIGLLFVIGAPMLLYMVMSTTINTFKPILIVLLILCIGMAILTGSRMTAFSMIVSLGLIALPLVKRPGLLLAGGAVGAIVLPLVLSVNEDAAARLGDLSSSGRLGIWQEYLMTSLKRPLGLFGKSGVSVQQDAAIGMHPHSSWIEMLYIGGWPYLIMLLTVAIVGLKSTWLVWKNRYIYGDESRQFLIHVIAALIASFYFQSLFNQALYHPTFTMSFIAVLLTILIIAMAQEVPQQRMLYEEWLLEEEWEDEDSWENSENPASS